MLCGLVRLVAQEFRIKQVKINANGQVVIDYESDLNGRFTLLQGPTVTNITTPLLTSPGQAGIAEFTTPNPLPNKATF